MAWEYEGLFDSIIETGTDDLISAYWRNEPTEILVGSMGYRTRTIKAGTRLEAEVHPIFGREKQKKLKAARKNITTEKQQAQNMKRSKRRLVLMLEANFRADEDIHLTLTYADPVGYDRCLKDIGNYFRKIRRARDGRNLPELKYLYAVGHDEGQRLHVHVIMNGGISREELEKLWGKGYANSMVLQEYGSGLQGIANYLYKQNEKERVRGNRRYLKTWSGSRNLKKPKEHTSDCKMSNRKVRIVAGGLQGEAKEVMEKIYPGYVLQECKVYYSDVVDGVYIRCVMRQWKDVS